MVGHEKEIDSRRVREGDIGHIICRTYRGSKTRVKTRCGRAENVKEGLHQGSALSPLLFIIMDVLAEKARTKPPWTMLFADDLVLVSETVE